MTKIQAVLFDYGMVLSGPPDVAAREQMEALLHADQHSFHTTYWRFRDAYDRGSLNAPDYWRAVATELGRQLDKTTLAQLIDADTTQWSQPNEPMIRWAAALQHAGIKTGILSNIGDGMEAGIRNRFGWLNDFAHHTFSHRLGIAKPDAAIYQQASQGLQAAPNEILFIDDREENILAARVAGMVAVQYSTHDAFIAAMQNAGLGYLILIDAV